MRELTDDQKREIHKHRGLPLRDIARRVGVSLSSVSKTLATPAPTKRKQPAAPKTAPMKRKAPAAPPSDAAEAEGTPMERLNRAIVSLESAARQAASDGDIARVIQAQKAVGDMTALIERLRPAPAVAVDDRPDMQAAAEAGRKHMHELLDRLLQESAK